MDGLVPILSVAIIGVTGRIPEGEEDLWFLLMDQLFITALTVILKQDTIQENLWGLI